MKRFFVLINDPFLVVCIHVDEKIEFYRDLDSLEQLDFLSLTGARSTQQQQQQLHCMSTASLLRWIIQLDRAFLLQSSKGESPTCTCTCHAFDD